MIANQLYRYRIGIFNLTKCSGTKCRKLESKSYCDRIHFIFMSLLIYFSIIGFLNRQMDRHHSKHFTVDTACNVNTSLVAKYYFKNDMIDSDLVWFGFIGNFYARYINGNILKSAKGLRAYHINVRSLKNKVNEIKDVMESVSPHILGCSECELKNEYDAKQLKSLKIPGYQLILPKSWELHGYARVVVYIKKSLKYDRIDTLEDDHLQTIWLKCGFQNTKPAFFCNGYREHNSNIGGSLEHQYVKLSTFVNQWEEAIYFGSPDEPNDVFILCDMNLDSYQDKWKNSSYKLYKLSQLVLRSCNTNNSEQIVNSVTRVQHNSVANFTSISCLDHIYTNVKYKCSAPEVICFGDSDHDLIGITRLSKRPPEPTRTIRKRSYKFFDKEQFLCDISTIDWSDIVTNPDLDEATNIFTAKFKEVLNYHAPWIIYQQRKHHKVWITKETKELMNERDSWKKKAKALSVENRFLGPSQEELVAWRKFRDLRNKINNIKKNEEYKYKKQIISEADESPRKTWSCIKRFMDWKCPGTPNQIVVNNVLYKKAADVATVINDFFLQKVENHKNKFKGGNLNVHGCRNIMLSKNCSLELGFVSVKKVEEFIRNLKSSKAVAVDELDSYSLKISAKFVALPIHHIITLSIMQQQFPSAWKLSKVLPLHKKGCTLERNNYRPVSILSPISKVIERVVYEQIYSYFARNKLFHANVMGFRRNRSTLTSILQMYDRWVQGAGESMISGVVFLDLSAAFDLVDSSLLIKKLEIYGLKADMIAWLKSYLTDRMQAVWIDHCFSSWREVTVGLPQGSILGPLLFTIFSNDLPELISCEADQYADDNTLTSVKSTISEINEDLNLNCQEVSGWMNAKRMALNADKTHLMIAGTSQRVSKVNQEQINICMDNISLKQSDDHSEKVLGVFVQQNLKWTKHIEDLKSKLKLRLAGLGKIRHVLHLEERKLVAKAIFESVLTYCIAAWGGASKCEIEELQVLQNKAAQFVLNLPQRSSRDQMFNNLGWLTVNQLSVFHTLLAVYNIRQSKEPEYLAKKLCRDNARGNIIISFTNLTLLKKSFIVRGAELWNSVPFSIRSLRKVAEFKNSLKEWIRANVEKFM